MEFSQYINKKGSLQEIPDDDFEKIVKQISLSLYSCGFEPFIQEYMTHQESDMEKEWSSLKRYNQYKGTTISATCTIGMKILKTFMTHFYDVKNHKGISVSSLWTPDNLEKALRFNRKYHTTPYASEIVRSLSFTNGLGKITMYRPLIAKLITQYFNAKSVLDVCGGWGGRMIGCCASHEDVKYTAFEPCQDTYNGLINIKKFLNLDQATIIHQPAEEGLLLLRDDELYDIGLTSPPYYNLEIYSNEESQSFSRYPTYEEWVVNFLEPLITGVLKHVRYSCWSVKNFKTNKTYNLYDDVVRIHEKKGWKQLEVSFAMKNSKRPGVSKNKKKDEIKKTEEITYVFVKNI